MVIVTAATVSDDPVQLAGLLARDRARVVVAVGAVGMDLPRPAYYSKALELRLSRSYGPRRYDREDERGIDYPIRHVRRTERRNMGAFVDLLESGSIAVEDLITARVAVDAAPTRNSSSFGEAYTVIRVTARTPSRRCASHSGDCRRQEQKSARVQAKSCACQQESGMP